MRRLFTKSVLLLCVAALLVALVPLGVMPVAAAKNKVLAHRSETTLMEKIIERDGFLDGIWYPWFTHTYLGCGLTTNEMAQQYLRDCSNATNCWYAFDKVGFDEYGPDKIYREIYNLKSLGYNLLGYEGSIYSEGVLFDDHGDVIGIKDEYLYNVRRFLDICRDIGMPVLWTVTCHSSSVNHYYTNGKNFWDRACRYYADKTVADHYAQRFVRPLAKVLAEYPDVVAMVASTSEAENEMNDSQVGNFFEGDRAHYGVDQEHMLYFVNAVTEAVKKEFPAVPRTICCQLDDMSLYSEVDFDILGDQNYNYLGRADALEGFRPTVPMFGSEYGWGDNVTCTDAELTKLQIAFRTNYRKEGFQGCVMWCWQPDSKSNSAYDLLKKGSSSLTDFRDTAYDLYFYMQEQRDQHRGDKTVLDTPSLFYQTGNDMVEWIAPRQTVYYDFLRSDDGGKTWVTEVSNKKIPSTYAGGKMQSVSKVSPTAQTVYKVVVRDGKGNEKSSQVSNKVSDAKQFGQKYSGSKEDNKTYDLGNFPFNQPVKNAVFPIMLTSVGVNRNRPAKASDNLLKDGSFESALGGFSAAAALKSVKDSTAPAGEKSLLFDTSAIAEAAWYTFYVDVKKNTEYTFSVWVKGAHLSSTNRGYASVGVADKDNGRFLSYADLPFYTQTQQIVPTAWDNGWHLRSVSFNSGNRTKVGIALYGCSSKMWVDDMALYESGQGAVYKSANMTQSISTRIDVEYAYCADAKNLFKNATMDQSASYWKDGSGWDGGFLSVANNKYEYGKSLKYTATAQSNGQYYLRWVDVQPNTWYTFSVDMKVLKNGEGRLILLDGKLRNPTEIVSVRFDGDTFGNDWFHYVLRMNTGSHTRIALGVVDGGGSALLDNLRLFKTADGIAGDDTFIDPDTGNTVAPPTATVKPTTRPTAGESTTNTTIDGGATTPTDSTTIPTDPTGTQPSAPTQEGDTAPTDPTTDDPSSTDTAAGTAIPWLWIAIGGAVLLIGGGVALFLILRKKKA